MWAPSAHVALMQRAQRRDETVLPALLGQTGAAQVGREQSAGNLRPNAHTHTHTPKQRNTHLQTQTAPPQNKVTVTP